MTIGVIPAYGRDYKSQKAILADWDANLDFEVSDFMNAGRKINKSDLETFSPGETVIVRYDRQLKQFAIKA